MREKGTEGKDEWKNKERKEWSVDLLFYSCEKCVAF